MRIPSIKCMCVCGSCIHLCVCMWVFYTCVCMWVGGMCLREREAIGRGAWVCILALFLSHLDTRCEHLSCSLFH